MSNKTKNETNTENKNQTSKPKIENIKNNSKEIKIIKIPKVKELTDKEKIDIYKDELLKKDKRIVDLEQQNKILLDLSLRNTKKRLEELENK
ncbi:MAG: hypothetical protein WC758_06595 [Candidatus Woesearchaeota archaeon]|jgi:hypothetical protein